jgi:WD40 repeat protein
VVWTRDDALLAVAVTDGSLRVWDAASGEVVHVLREHAQMVRSGRPAFPRTPGLRCAAVPLVLRAL